MEEILNRNYAESKGILTFTKLYKKAKPEFPKLTLKAAKEFVDRQENAQLFKQGRKDLFTPIVAPDNSYQCDLLFLKQAGRLNPVLVAIEITTRRAFLRLLPNKTAQATATAFQSILDTGAKIQIIEHDDGAEFKGAFEALLQANNITDITFPSQENSKTSLGKVERLNLTIRQWWNKGYKDRIALSKFIPEIETFYNNEEHSTTHQKPIETDPEQARAIDLKRGYNARKAIETNFKQGQQVRIREETDVFRKKSEPKWKRAVHTISSTDGINIQVSDEDRAFRAWELLPIANNTQAQAKLEPLPKQVPKRIRKLKEEVETTNIQEQPRVRAAPKRAVEPPKPQPKKQAVYTPEAILGHQIVKVKGRNKLFLEVRWKDASPEINEKYQLQPIKNFATPEGINPLFNKYLSALKKKDPQEWKRIDNYF